MTFKNFEKQIKKKLDERAIQPSERSWDEVASALKETNGTGRNNYYRYAIAAGFIGILIISVAYFNWEGSDTPEDPQIVNTPSKNDTGKHVKTTQNGVIMTSENGQKETNGNAEKERIKAKKGEPEKEIMLAAVERGSAMNPDIKVSPAHSEEIIETKVAELIAQVDILEKNDDTLTDAEVDSLLRRAQKEILAENLLKENRAVDAAALLNEVEDELDQSFRDQIFEKLKTGFIKVRTAVADRNN
jgi:hypothetical protein